MTKRYLYETTIERQVLESVLIRCAYFFGQEYFLEFPWFHRFYGFALA